MLEFLSVSSILSIFSHKRIPVFIDQQVTTHVSDFEIEIVHVLRQVVQNHQDSFVLLVDFLVQLAQLYQDFFLSVHEDVYLLIVLQSPLLIEIYPLMSFSLS